MATKLGRLAAALAVVVMAGTLVPAPAVAHLPGSGEVVPIGWERFSAGLPPDAQAERTREILLNTNRYALQTWYPAKFSSQTGEYLDLGGTVEGNIRPPGSEALALATSLATGAYDENVTGVPASRATEVAVRITTSIAYRHEANHQNGWGTAWQSALWAFNAAFAGWLLWDELPAADQDRLARMVSAEADAFLYYQVPYYQDENGKVITPGDSKAEENAWNAAFLNLAVSMMPEHPNRDVWQDKALELMISAYARPSDLTNPTEVNGKTVAEWLNGSNIFNDGTLVNHSRIHPDYFTSIANSVGAPLAYRLAGLPTPQASLFNADVVYDALVNNEFTTPPYAAPGGTIYKRSPDGAATADIYYPQGNDWGTSRQQHFLLLDTLAATFGFDARASAQAGVSATKWAEVRAERALSMQARFADGRTYGERSEDTYSGREEWVALLAARTYLTHWLRHNTNLTTTNRAYPVTPADYPGASISLGAVSSYPRGVATPLTLTVRSRSTEPLHDASAQPTLPAGWTAVATGPTTGTIAPGATFSVTWMITPDPPVVADRAQLHAAVNYRHRGRVRQLEATAFVSVPPGLNLAAGAPVTVSSALRATTGGDKAVDGLIIDASRWISAEGDAAPTLTVSLPSMAALDSIYVYSGYAQTNHDITSVLKDFTVEVHTDAGWLRVAAIVDNTSHRVVVPNLGVRGDQVRLLISDPSRSTLDVARVFEVEVYQA